MREVALANQQQEGKKEKKKMFTKKRLARTNVRQSALATNEIVTS